MKEAVKAYCEGLEFYRHPEMGLCGVENNTEGAQHTYQYLTDEEAKEWINKWLIGEHWSRKYGPLSELLESA